MIRSRSQIHMLAVMAARLAEAHADPALVTALRQATKVKARQRARGETGRDPDAVENDRRIDRNRTLFNVLPSCRQTDALKAAMLQRAYDLMWDGDCAGCDALTEFLPSDDVTAMFDAWESDQFGDKPKSKWYGADGG